MAKLKEKGKDAGYKKCVLDCQDDIFDLRAKIIQGRLFSCINLSIESRGSLSEHPQKLEAVDLTINYYQAQVLAEVLQNFISSRDAQRRALTPVMVTATGEIRWSTFGYPV